MVSRMGACCLLLLVLPACGIPPLRRADPGRVMPASFNGVASAENSSQLGVEAFYNDPRLAELIHQGLRNNRELKNLEQEVQIASFEILSRSGAYLPFLDLGASSGLERASESTLEGAALSIDEFEPGQFFNNPYGAFWSGTNLRWQIDIYRQLRNARDAAAQRYDAAVERRNYFITQLVADIAENYYSLMALDKRIENLTQITAFLEQSLKVAEARKEAARDTELAVLRFEAEIRKNQSEMLIVNQDIILAENRINALLYRYPQRIDRDSTAFYDLTINALNVGIPSDLLQNRPDIRAAERRLAATGLDVKVARVNFYPQLVIDAGVGLASFSPADLFIPQAVAGKLAQSFVGPLINKRAIRAEYLTANANQLQAIYDYQNTILNAFTEVVNRLSTVRNFTSSVEVKKQQLIALESAVDVADSLFQFARVEYLDVLTAQRDLRDARFDLIDTKEEQLISIVRTYQSLGGGDILTHLNQGGYTSRVPRVHTVARGETFETISEHYYHSSRYYKALWKANRKEILAPNRLTFGDRIIIPPASQLDQTLIEQAMPGTAVPFGGMPGQAPPAPTPEMAPPGPALAPPPPAPGAPSPFGPEMPLNPAPGGIAPPAEAPGAAALPGG